MSWSAAAPGASGTRLAAVAVGVGLAVLLALSGGLALGAANDADATALRASQAALGRVTGDHEFIDQHGRPLRLAGLQGRPLALNLVYTSCYDICSSLTLYLRDAVRIARETLGPGSFSVLTVGFDTEHDSPERMRIFARDRGIDDPDWHLVSADAATIRRLADEVGFTWAASPTGFDHVAQVSIVDADGKVVRQVYGQDFAPPALVEPLKALVLGRTLERLSVRDVIDRVRLYCSVYDPASGRYRFDYSMLAGAIPPLMALGMAAVAIVVAGRARRRDRT
jgi:protein SCO1/2